MRSPKRACSVCRRLGCTDPRHVRKPFAGVQRRLSRPEFNTPEQRRRRAATVSAFLSEHGFKLANGDVVARCPECRQVRARFAADHLVPIALGGREDGELGVHCLVCSRKQGAGLASRKRS